jgi:hypothetical protein
MSSIPDQFPVSLRAWPSKDDKGAALASLITRINLERGNFRNVEEGGVDETVEEDDTEEEEPDRLKELATAREDILIQLE